MTSTATRRTAPIATYRLQFNRLFTFQHATQVVPYLHTLGISDCYASSYLKATPGSLHGYDIVDPTTLNPEIGTEDDYRAFTTVLRQYGMGQILDIVPNHMGISRSSNSWWLDVLEHGPSSRYAEFFDIDWHPVKPELEHKILLPILGDLYGIVLENQEIILSYEDGAFFVRYYDHKLPVSSKSMTHLLSHRVDELVAKAGSDDPDVMELQSITTALSHLPGHDAPDRSRQDEELREKEIVKRRLNRLVRESPLIAGFLEENVRIFNGSKQEPKSFDLLDRLLNDQAYRLAYWRVASEEINYRRFFDINELAAVRMENPSVFREAHGLVLRLLKEGAVTGLRIDHVDGLYDPGGYLRSLQSWAREELPEAKDSDRPLYLVAEKILSKGETLPESWPVDGTTGYEFLNAVNALFVDSANDWAFDELYSKFIRHDITFEDLAYEKKKLIMAASMASEINTLGHFLNRFSERDRRSRDFTLNSLIHAIREIIACFPVYRTYIGPDTDQVANRDREYIRLAVTRATRRNPAMSRLVFDFIQDILLNRAEDRLRLDREERLTFLRKFQQTTSPVTAKGIEDTALYIYNRLLSLNEVGGEPERFGIPVPSFHERMRDRQARWPYALSTTSTHDTKRGEDVRARLNVLSEIPGEWKKRLGQWSKLNKKFKPEVEGHLVPDRNEEYFLYQTLIGAWPFVSMSAEEYRTFCRRIHDYMDKALHEAKVHSSWINPDATYDQAMHKYIEAILDRTRPNPFLDSFLAFQQRVAALGVYNSLSQVLLKITAPGVPDFYQGSELWDLALVDPDNRRPVDYPHRIGLVKDLETAAAAAGEDRRDLIKTLSASYQDGRIKVFITMLALRYRRDHPQLFLDGAYFPLETAGAKKDHLCAFARAHDSSEVIVIVPRLIAGLLSHGGTEPLGPDVWQDTHVMLLPDEGSTRHYRNVLTGDIISVGNVDDGPALRIADVLKDCPLALLENTA